MYSKPDINIIKKLDTARQRDSLCEINSHLSKLTAPDRVKWALNSVKGAQALTSSFGIQSAVCLHMYTSVQHDIPIIMVDTGYMIPETYLFVEKLKCKLNLNLKVYTRAEKELNPYIRKHYPEWQCVELG